MSVARASSAAMLALLVASCGGERRAEGASATFDAFAALRDPYGLARRVPGVAHVASSRVPEGVDGRANEDWSYYDGTDGDADVLLRASGPGVVTRIWMTIGDGTGYSTVRAAEVALRLRVDGHDVSPPTWTVATLGDAFPGVAAPWSVAPLAGGSGAWIASFPVQFQSELLLTARPPAGTQLYYQLDWTALPAETSVAAYDGAPSAAQLDALDVAQRTWADLRPGAQLATMRLDETSRTLAVSGPAVIRRVRIAPGGAPLPDDLALTLVVDGAPAGAAPVADVFTTGHPASAFEGGLLRADTDGSASLGLPISVATSATLTLDSASGAPFSADLELWGDVLAAPAQDLGRFRFACTTVTEPASRDDVETISVTGRGHFAGQTTRWQAGAFGWEMLEGDQQVTVDGTPSLFGTGVEDYFGGGFYFHDGPFAAATSGVAGWDLHGLPRLVDHVPAVAVYRVHALDAIPFERDFRFAWESFDPGTTVHTCAFWYVDP